MNKDWVCGAGLDEINHQQRKWHVLGEVGVNTNGAEHPIVAGVANRDLEAASQAKRSHAQGDENDGQQRGIDWKDLHILSGT